MKSAFVRFHDNSLRLTLTLSDTGKRKRYFKVSSMLNWCARNGYTPYFADPEGLQDNGKEKMNTIVK